MYALPDHRDPTQQLPSKPGRPGRVAAGHTVQFYNDDAYIVDEVGRFIGAALGAGDAAIVIATQLHHDLLAKHLSGLGFDLARSIDGGRYVALDARAIVDQYARADDRDFLQLGELIGGVIARAATSPAGGQRPVAIFGEIVAVLCQDGRFDAATRLERRWNALAERHVFSLLCAYPMKVFSREADGDALAHICAEHSAVMPAESYASLRDEGERRRAIALLQQKATALAIEVQERERVQVALAEQNRALAAAVAARDEFLSVAAHELKTPITSLRAYAQLLLRDIRQERPIAPDRLESALGAIEQQTDKLRRLIARLLDAEQIEAGKLRVEPVPTDLVSLTHAAVAPYRVRAEHTLVVESPTTLMAQVDALRFEQVITNLLDNAIKYSPQGGRVVVNLRRSESDGVVLSVTDQGIGIPRDQRDAVFGRFQQAHGVGHLSGLGLGLAITREIVLLHGGTVGIEEPESGGTRMVVTLPPQ